MPSSHTELRRIAHALLEHGELIATAPSRLNVKLGTGQYYCCLCQVKIGTRDVECDISVEGDVDPPTFRFHAACHRAWFEECEPSVK